MSNLKTKTLLVVPVALVMLTLVKTQPVYAGCESEYGGGETCVYNKSFSIQKKVRFEGDDDWEDKIFKAEEGDEVEFRIRIKNTGEIEVDNMEMKDELPDGLDRIGGSGLTEYWDNFEPGETKEFVIKAKVTDEAFDDNSKDCLVNEARAYYDDKYEGKDVATVCVVSEEEIKELPETGSESAIFAAVGLGLIALGLASKKAIL